MLNKVQIIGRLGADAEMTALNNGGAVTTANIATSRSWNNKQTGQREEKTEWHRVVFFNIGNYKLAEIAGEYLKKGGLVYVEGRIETRKWQDKNGIDRYTTEIIAETMHMLGGKQDSYKNNIPPVEAYESQAPQTSKQAAPVAPVADAEFDDDIPF